jgi:spore germination cell wall hydrolase CwlJ-like protein
LAIILATASAAVGASLTSRSAVKAVKVEPAVVKTEAVQPVKLTAADAVKNQLLAEHRCLSEVLYYEARGEGDKGQKAVAEVVFHRMNSGNYGHSICAVVYEGAGRPGCQFTFTCNGDLDRKKDDIAWLNSERLAAQILTDQAWRKDTTGGATNYHATTTEPVWAPTLVKTGQIGNHVFYRNAVARARNS